MLDVIKDVGLHRRRLEQLVATAPGPVRIASAYVTDSALFANGTAKNVCLLTALSPLDIVSGATSLDALEKLVGWGVECRVQAPGCRLHAKVYLFGSEFALVTSANLTKSAMDSNIEVGVQISGSQIAALTRWFDELWDSAEAIDAARLSRLRRRTEALRQEFRLLRGKCRLLDQPGTRPDTGSWPQPSRGGSAFGFFLCNTNRRYGDDLEELMRERRFAAAWEEFKFTNHMEEVKRGDIILMHANKIGILGVGKATDRCERLEPGSPGRIDDDFEDWGGQDAREWRVPVDWLRWVTTDAACPWNHPPPTTFQDVSGDAWRDRRNATIGHFFPDPAIVQDLGLSRR
jgi:hypothetical protein